MGRRAAVLPILLALTLAVALCSGCAITHEQNRRVLNKLDARVAGSDIVKDAQSMALWGVAFVPIGLAAGLADLAIVNPIHAAPAAARETEETVWGRPSGDQVQDALMFVPKLVATPIVFGGYWSFFVLFPVEYERGDEVQTLEKLPGEDNAPNA